jgi:RNA polymerase sigma-B factor
VSARTGRTPTVAELAEYLEVSVEDATEGLEAAAAHHATSIDPPLSDGEDEQHTLIDTLGTEDERLKLAEASATIAAAAQALDERERLVLALRFAGELTQSEIARQIGVSQMQVSRILRRALERLRDLTDDQVRATTSRVSAPGWLAAASYRDRHRG